MSNKENRRQNYKLTFTYVAREGSLLEDIERCCVTYKLSSEIDSKIDKMIHLIILEIYIA